VPTSDTHKLHDDSSFNISADVGWGSIHGVAELIMEHLAPMFGVTQTGASEEGGHSDAVLSVTFEPAIPDDRWAEFSEYLGQKPY
jgi:hypothetical protein